MRIVSRLNFVAAGTLGALLVLAPWLMNSLVRLREAKVDFLLADQIKDNCLERDSIRDHYLLYREASAHAMWEQRWVEVDRLMQRARTQLQRPKEKRLLAQLERAINENTLIYRRIVATSAALHHSEADPATFAELDKRLVSQLLLKATAVRVAATELQDTCGEVIDQAFERLVRIALLFTGVLGALLIFISRQIGRAIHKRMLPLHAGVQRVAAGDLSFRLPSGGSDEFSELATAINTMSEKLMVFTQQIEAESAERTRQADLRESEEKYRTLLANLTVGVVVHGTDTVIRFSNPMAGELLGLTEDQMRGKSAMDPRWCFLRDDASPMPLEDYPVNRVLGSGAILQNQVVGVCRPDRTEPVWLLCNGFPARDEQGALAQIVITFSDITERKVALEALQLERETAERYLDMAQVLFVALDTEARVTMLNPKGHAMLGYAEGELKGKDWFQCCLPPEERQDVLDVYRRIMSGDMALVERYENHILRRNGERRLIAWHNTLLKDGKGKLLGTLSSGEDITARRQAEEEIRDSEARFRALVENAPEAIVVFDLEKGNFVDLNENACRLYGVSRAELLTKGPIDFSPPFQPDGFPSAQRAMEMIQMAVDGGSPRFEWAHINARGEDIPCEINLTRLPASSRVLIRASIADISNRKRMEAEQRRLTAQLQQAQKLDSLGSLAGGVAHDMNNVLGAILGLASAHQEIQPDGSPAQRAFETITKAAQRGRDLVKGLLGFARQGLAETALLDLNAIIRDEVRILERTTLSRINLQLELDEQLCPVHGDASALTHAIMNLCVNAVDAMPTQGTLTLRTRKVDSNWVEVQIEDSGVGMSPQVLEKAMDPFFTTKEVGKGTGLGLSLVYSTVKAHHGQMEIRSEPGKGTCVQLRFPAGLPGPAPTEGMPGPADPRVGRALKVLLVDDDELVQSSSQALLEVLGHEVSLASCGEEALEQIAAGLDPDVTILDMNMPGLGGLGTLPRLRKLRPDLPVLLATGRVDQVALDLVAQIPKVVMMPKPFSLNELRKQLEDLDRD